MSEERVRVLLLDDEESLRVPLKRFLEKNFGYHVDAIASGGEALQKVEEVQGHYDVALIDEVLLDKRDGIQVMEEIKARYPDIECIVFTGWGTESRQRALQAGAFRYLEKPFDNDELAMLIRTAAQQVRLRNIGRAILLEQDLDRVLEGITAAACSLALADEAAIVLLDRGTGRLRVHAKTYPAEQQWQRHFKNQDLSKEIIQTGQVVQVPDTTQDTRVDQKVIDADIRSFLGVPIPGEGGNSGVLYVYSHRPGRFDEWGTVAVLQTLAGQASLAIANAQAFQQIHAHAGYMEALVQAGQGLTRTTRLEDQLALAWDFVREQLKVSTFFVSLYDKQTDILRLPLLHDEGQQIEIDDRLLGDNPRQWGITGYVIKIGQELHWPTHEDKKRQCCSLDIKAIQIGKPCQSCFYLPLKIGDEVIGAMSMQSYDRHAFSPIVLDACRALGSQLSVALENARLVTETQRRAANLETLQNLALTMSSSLQLDDTLKAVCQAAVEFFNTDHSGLVLFDTDYAQGQVRAEYPALGTLGKTIPLRGVPAEERLIETEEPLVISDVASDESLGPVQDTLLKFDIQSIVIVPVIGKNDKVLGSFSLDAVGHTRQFTEEEVKLCRVFAAHVAVAIEIARLFQERQILLDTSRMVSSAQDLDQSLQTLAERLVKSLAITFCRISLLDDTGRMLKIRAAYPILDDLPWTPGIGQQYLLTEAPEEAKAIETGQSQLFRWEETPDLLSSLEQRTNVQGGLKWAVVIPLAVGGNVFGVITLGERRSWERGLFVQERIALCESMADQVAALIARRKLQEQIQREMQEKAKLLEQVSKARDTAKVVAEVSVLEDLRSTLNSIAKGTQDALHCDAVTLYTYDQIRDEFGFPPAMVGVRDTGEVLKFGLVARESVIRQILALDEAHVAKDALSDSLMGGAFVKREGIKSSVGIPLKVGERKVGVMFVNYRSSHRFTTDELTNIELFANQASVAIRNAQLYDELQKRAAALQALYEAGRAITGTLSLDEILRHIVEQAWRLAELREGKTHFSHLALVDGNRIRFVAAYPSEALTKLQDGVHEIDLERDVPIGITGRIVVTRQSRLVENVLEDPDYIETDPRVRSQLGVPIQMGERFIGVINVEHPDYNAFGEEDQQVLESLAAQAAIAIQNAQQHEELKRTKGLVGARTALAWMGMASSSWRHAIRNYATTIQDLVELARRDIAARATAEKVRERLSRIEDMVAKIQGAPITAPLQAEEGVRSVVINELLEERVKQLWGREPYKGVQIALDLRADETATVRASPDWLRRAFDILIDNAVEAMVDSATRQLTVVTQLMNSGVEVAIKDTGKGIPNRVLQRLFQAPISKPKGSKGLGVGLLMAHTIVQTYRGDIRLDSTGPSGTTMIIWLPVES